ncbi:extracellular solute-binding protein [Kineosporia rhizophila]|uniref:extracellular solute-binding protein n=1 Tax=Kineosporia TaxID=49184 RepID=UPI001E4BDA39|nr:extracellular solute-binding protein [Kineosporia sp. NBRC 101677]MCE0538859.1 extracellular solute-binding protein [Kineosporia rhizophila]GLY18777.1 sugar ABC transporter substrate-binding protein [Kineosporia sp. NBRC 101677]
MKIRALAAVGIATALALSACGGDSDDTSGGSNEGEAKTGTVRLWLNGEDTPQELVDYAKAEFEKANPGSKLEFERQQWTGIVEKLTTSLSSSDSPDVVELGNTQAQAFEAAGALYDISDKKAELGGDDLVQSLVESGSYDGKFYGVPYYGGARIVVYRKDLFEKAGLEIPTSTQEFVDAGIKLKQENAAEADFSGIYYPGKYWYAALPFIWDEGGDIAVKEGDAWVGKLSSPQSVAGLTTVKKIMDEASAAPKDADEAKDYLDFCKGKIGMLMGPGWKVGQILNEDDGCPKMEKNIGAFALPGKAPGTTAPAFLGGSNLAISAKSANPELAYSLLKIMASEGYQTKLADLGLLPVKKSLLGQVTGDEAAEAQAKAAENTRFTPASENWAGVEAGSVLPDMLVAIAQGKDVAAEAKTADEAIASALNQ